MNTLFILGSLGELVEKFCYNPTVLKIFAGLCFIFMIIFVGACWKYSNDIYGKKNNK